MHFINMNKTIRIDNKFITLDGKYPMVAPIFTPIDIAGNVLWLEPSIENVVLRDNQYVSQWTDKSGLGNHATQVTEASQPLYVTNGLNNRSVLRFDGSDDSFALGSTFDIGSCFVVCNHLGTTYGGYQALLYSGNVHLMTAGGTELYPDYFDDWYVNGIATKETAPIINYKTISVVKTGTIISELLTIGLNIYWNHDWNGDIVEIIIYNRALTTEERQQVETYLNQKYALY